MQRILGRKPETREHGIRVDYLGPRGSFTEEAALLCFPRRRSEFYDKTTIRDVFQTVNDWDDFGVVPIENSIEGPVNQTLDLLWQYNLNIVGEAELAINHSLLAKPGTRMTRIRRVYSHPNALGQCSIFLRTNLPDAAHQEVESTSRAALLASKRPGTAAIAGQQAARVYGLIVLARRIQDHRNNYTRFIVISRKEPSKSGPAKTSLVFVTKHRPGALWRALEPFARERINLTKIESRPVKSRPWEYSFYVDFEGHIRDQVPSRALKLLLQRTTFLKILGSYPRWRPART